jgi:FMN phosphatase YigB (HAD superfamily)
MLESVVPIEALLFDLGRVIVDVDTSECEGVLAARSKLSLDRFHALLSKSGWVSRYERGEVTTFQFYEFLSTEIGLCMDYEDFCRTWSGVFDPIPILPTALLSRLARRYKMTLISNTNEVHASYIRANYDVLNCFGNHVLSYEVGSLKPESTIFQIAIASTQQRPENIMFIDDLEENVQAARAMGLQTHQFRSRGGLRRAFLEFGVEVEWPLEELRESG